MAFDQLPSSKAMQHWVHEARECVRRSGPVFLTVCIFNISFQLISNLFEPFLRTYVACPGLPGDQDGGAGVAGGVFSGSPLCGDRNFVVQSAARTFAAASATASYASVLSLPLLGAVSDDKGRLPVLWTCIAGRLLGTFCVVAFNGWAALLYTGFLLTGFAAAFFPTFQSILGDHGGNRTLAFTIKIFAAQTGSMAGIALATLVLRLELLDYTVPMRAVVGLLLVASASATRISESRPPSPERAASRRAGGWAHYKGVLVSVILPLRSRFFSRYCVADFLNYVVWSAVHVLRSYSISALGWKQGSFEMFMMVNTVCGVISTLCCPAWVRRWGAEAVVRRCMKVQAVACMFLILSPLHSVFFVVPIIVVSTTGCRVTASTTLIAERFKDHTGKAMATIHGVVHCGMGTGPLLFSRLYFAGATGVLQAAPFVAVAACSIASHFQIGRALDIPADPAPHEAGPAPQEARYTELELAELESGKCAPRAGRAGGSAELRQQGGRAGGADRQARKLT